jgi:multidrug efflux pump subunit AcrA (membrane-fusion protein)
VLALLAAGVRGTGRRARTPGGAQPTDPAGDARQPDAQCHRQWQLQPTRSVNIGSELSGTVLKVNVDVNDRIRKGQVLVELDTAKLRDQILRSRATLAAANAKVAQTVATVAEARASLARLEEVARLSGGKVPSKAELDTGRATWSVRVADNASARAGVADAQAACRPTKSTCPRPRSARRPTAWC